MVDDESDDSSKDGCDAESVLTEGVTLIGQVTSLRFMLVDSILGLHLPLFQVSAHTLSV